MKTTVIVASLCGLLFSNSLFVSAEGSPQNSKQAGSTLIYSTPDLYPLISAWVTSFNQEQKDALIRVQPVDQHQPAGDLFFTNRIIGETSQQEGSWRMAVGKEVIVPVISANNPYYKEIAEQGINSDKLAQLFSDPRGSNWGTLTHGGSKETVHFYFDGSESTRLMTAHFLKISPEQLAGYPLESKDDIVVKVGNDPLSIGFCRWTSLYQSGSNTLAAGIHFLPFDLNKNGRLDGFEDIYTDASTFSRGIWIGKYPKALFQDVYSLSSAQPVGKTEVEFLKWVLTAGQPYLNQFGYTDLVSNDRMQKLEMLGVTTTAAMPEDRGLSRSNWALIITGGILFLALVVSSLMRIFSIRKSTRPVLKVLDNSMINEESIHVYNGIYFDKSHTWAFMEKDGAVKVGIDDFLQHLTGPLTRIVMKKPGEKITKGEPFLDIIQEGKHLSIKSPVTGTIKGNNTMLAQDLTLINQAPYGEGWVYEVEPASWLKEIQMLFMADPYKNWIRNEFTRVKDFLAMDLKKGEQGFATVILQDGGALQDHVLANLGPEVWDDFQTEFLDTAR